MRQDMYSALRLAGLLTENDDPNEERFVDLQQGLSKAESPEESFEMLYNMIIKHQIDKNEFIQLAMSVGQEAPNDDTQTGEPEGGEL